MLLLHAVIDADWTMNSNHINKSLENLERKEKIFQSKYNSTVTKALICGDHRSYLKKMKSQFEEHGVLSHCENITERKKMLEEKCSVFEKIRERFFDSAHEYRKVLDILSKQKEICANMLSYMREHPGGQVCVRLVRKLKEADRERKQAVKSAHTVCQLTLELVQLHFEKESAIAKTEAEMGVNPVIFTERDAILKQ